MRLDKKNNIRPTRLPMKEKPKSSSQRFLYTLLGGLFGFAFGLGIAGMVSPSIESMIVLSIASIFTGTLLGFYGGDKAIYYFLLFTGKNPDDFKRK